jgi:hypothetical protein
MEPHVATHHCSSCAVGEHLLCDEQVTVHKSTKVFKSHVPAPLGNSLQLGEVPAAQDAYAVAVDTASTASTMVIAIQLVLTVSEGT